MPTQQSASIEDQLGTILRVDKKRTADDPFKLPKFLRDDVTADLAALSDTDLATSPAEGKRAGASQRQRRAYAELERQLRGGYRFLLGIDEEEITTDERTEALRAYGWVGGKIGNVLADDAGVLANARLALGITAKEVPDAAHRYPDARRARIETQLGIIDADHVTATGGDRVQANRVRNAAMETAGTTALRVRFYYACASRDADQTTELTKIGFTPRHDPQPASAASTAGSAKGAGTTANPAAGVA